MSQLNVDRLNIGSNLRLPQYTTAQRDALSGVVTGDLIYNSSDEQVQVWDGTKWKGASQGGSVSATGGTITTSGNYKVHKFTNGGTFTVEDVGAGANMDILLVGGGGAGGNASGLHLVDNYLRQRNNNNKQQAEASIHGSMSMFNGEINQKYHNGKVCSQEYFAAPSSRQQSVPNVEQYGKLHGTQEYNNNKIGTDRINPDLLDAFKSNPYTQSLNSWA